MKESKACLLMTSALLFASAALAEGRWTEVRTGMELFTGSFVHRATQKQVRITAIRIDQNRLRLHLVDLSARQTAPTLSQIVGDAKVVAAINGGYVTSYAFPQPLGFARADGVTFGRMNTGKIFSGLICVGKNGRAAVIKTKKEPGPECADALQSGPFIVEEPGVNGISPSESVSRMFERSAVCLDASARLILVRTEPSALWDLGEFLRVSPFDCRVAINLSGDADSGLFWREKGQSRSAGFLDAALATALVVTAR